MKIFGLISPSRAVRPPRPFLGTRGAALIIVLSLIVLLAALVTVFLVRTGASRSTSASYDAAASTRMLAESTVNLVQATINEATAGSSGVAWASQPGAIRLFNDAGALTSIYRLYSGTSLVTNTNDGGVLAGDLPPSGWSTQSALWVDLNKPVTVSGFGSNTLVYPILDPRDPKNPGSVTAPNVLTDLSGFSIGTAPGATALQPAPMPVRWLYVLRNGEVVAPSGGSGSTATFSGSTVPSAQNPIIGRIAFWTDDETCKVNLNTAGGSSGSWSGSNVQPAPWDVPRFRLAEDLKLFSDNQPIHGEYQRYPGHPATTDLSAIFTSLGLPMGAYPASQTTAGTSSDFFKLLPKYDDQTGSKGGTVNTTTTASTLTAIPAKTDRLYTSTGETLFRSDRTENPNGSDPGVTRQQVETGKFFLTAHSRAPEVNLFGTPRIAMWPIDSDYGADPTPNNSTKLASTFDKLIAFCATTGVGANRHQYYFQRHDSTHPTNDWDKIPRNQQLFSYLQGLTGRQVPGFSGSFVSKYNQNSERDQILAELLDYIRCTNVYDHSVADYAAANSNPRFTPKFGTAGSGQVVPLQINNSRGLGRIYTVSEFGVLVICTADGNSPLGAYQPSGTISGAQVSPVKGSANDPLYVSNLPVDQYLRDNTGTKGKIVGWDNVNKAVVPGVSEDTLPPPVVTGTVTGTVGPFLANQTLTTTGAYGGPLQALQPGEKKLQAMLLFELASPMAGYDPMTPDLRIQVQGLNTLSIAGITPFPSASAVTDSMTSRLNSVEEVGGYNGFQYFISRGSSRVSGWSNTGAGSNAYNFVSNPFTVASNGTTQLNGSLQVALQVKDKTNSATYNTAQTFTVTLQQPAAALGLPDLIQDGLSSWNPNNSQWEAKSVPMDWWGFDNRIKWVSSSPSTLFSGVLSGTNYASGAGFLANGCVIRTDSGAVTPGVPVANWTGDRRVSVPLVFYKDASGASPAGTYSSDVVRTFIAPSGDMRLVAAKATVAADGSSDMVKTAGYDSNFKAANNFMQWNSSNQVTGADRAGKLVPNATYSPFWVPKISSSAAPQSYWDWDSGLPGMADGAYANKPDEGNVYTGTGNSHPYYWVEQTGSMKYFPSYFTANRIIPSPGMFGSLPTGVKENIPWRTLLIRPAQATRPSLGGPADHLFLDLFSMPVVEPYAISEPFSTAGKVNMNYQIVPFTYIKRSSGVRAVLSSELTTRIPLAAASAISGLPGQCYYKIPTGSAPTSGNLKQPAGTSMARLPLDLNETIKQFDERFSDSADPLKPKDLFRSASEICDLYLVPQGYGLDEFRAASGSRSWYGADFAMVGDNVRERPYADIYSRLTTKSNTFTVHYTVQALKNPPGSDPAQWNESRGVVTGQLRGSTTLERFLDPADSNIPDYALNPTAPSLDTFYQWRVISTNTFAP